MRTFVVAAGLALVAGAVAFGAGGDDEWTSWGRDPGGQRYSPLKSIDRGNVAKLQVAWTFHTGDAYQPLHERATAFEATPLYVDGTLFLSTPLGKVFALDPVSGKQRWNQ